MMHFPPQFLTHPAKSKKDFMTEIMGEKEGYPGN